MATNSSGSRGSRRRRVATHSGEPVPTFGGSWTEQKLDVLRNYLRAYTTALKAKPFELLYIDAFAGAGRSRPRRQESGGPEPDDGARDDQSYRDGSPRIALNTGAFHRYIFIEKIGRQASQLAGLRADFPQLAAAIEIIAGDANEVVPELCRRVSWRNWRGVIFIDPYGMQLSWSTLEAIAATRALDVWLLVPIMAINRLLVRSGRHPAGWERKLDRTLGTADWRTVLYSESPQLTLNGSIELIKEPLSKLLRFEKERLEGIFRGGVAEPGILVNSRDAPLYALFFAVSNPTPRAREIAHDIAGYLLRDLRRIEK